MKTFAEFAAIYCDFEHPAPSYAITDMVTATGISESSLQDYVDFARKVVVDWAKDPSHYLQPCPVAVIVAAWEKAHPPTVTIHTIFGDFARVVPAEVAAGAAPDDAKLIVGCTLGEVAKRLGK